jgi:hypothetical protein
MISGDMAIDSAFVSNAMHVGGYIEICIGKPYL